MYAGFWSPAAALCLVVAAVGLPRLVVLVRARTTEAVAASAFLAIGLVATLLAPNKVLGFLGLYFWGTGWLFTATLAGAWAVGRSLGRAHVVVVERALLAAALLNAVVALLESAVDLTSLHLGQYGGRSPGLLGNPIHLGAFAAAALTLVAPRFAASPLRWSLPAALLGGAIQASGSRFGVVVVVGVLVWVAVTHGRRTVALLTILVVVGGAGAAALSRGGTAESATVRVADAAGNGVRPRTETWRLALEAVADRPLVGYGPGQFRRATSPRRTVALARAEGADRLFVDAHNLVVEYAVTTGLLGLAALVAWLLLASRSASGPLLAFALADLANHLVEPQAVRTTPVVFLALGAAAAASAGVPLPSVGRAVTALLAAAALVAGGWLLVGDFHLEQAYLDFDLPHARRATQLLPYSEAASVRAHAYLFLAHGPRSDEMTRNGIHWLAEATRRDPGDPHAWNELGYRLSTLGRNREAATALRHALRLNPTSTLALNGLGLVATAEHDPGAAAVFFERSLAIDPTQKLPKRLLARS